VLDGVDAVAGKERTQQELAALVEQLCAAGRQVVVTLATVPGEARALDAALRARLEGGTAVKLRAPDRPLRERLYARAFAAARATPDSELLQFLAERPVAGAREVMTTAARLVAAAEVAGLPLSMRVARAELGASARGQALSSAAAPTADAFFLDEEKVIWDWPDVGGRVSEELR
jgi:chromosomal replication initiator protein